jgi:hypothetical protein
LDTVIDKKKIIIFRLIQKLCFIQKEVKMRGKLLVFSFLLMIGICFSSGAHAAEMTPEYLQGNWVIGTTEQKCGAVDSESFVFDKNGTFESGRAGKTEAVGFWQIGDDRVYLDFISSGAFFQDIHAELKAFANQFDYFKVELIPFNVEENRFEAIGFLGEQSNKGVAVRCR